MHLRIIVSLISIIGWIGNSQAMLMEEKPVQEESKQYGYLKAQMGATVDPDKPNDKSDTEDDSNNKNPNIPQARLYIPFTYLDGSPRTMWKETSYGLANCPSVRIDSIAKNLINDNSPSYFCNLIRHVKAFILMCPKKPIHHSELVKSFAQVFAGQNGILDFRRFEQEAIKYYDGSLSFGSSMLRNNVPDLIQQCSILDQNTLKNQTYHTIKCRLSSEDATLKELKVPDVQKPEPVIIVDATYLGSKDEICDMLEPILNPQTKTDQNIPIIRIDALLEKLKDCAEKQKSSHQQGRSWYQKAFLGVVGLSAAWGFKYWWSR